MFTEYPPKRIDMEHPDMATLPYEHVPLPTETKRQIYREHCRGDSADGAGPAVLPDRYHRLPHH